MNKLKILKYQQNQIFLKAAKKKVFAIFAKVGYGKTKLALDLSNKRLKEEKIDNIFWVSLKVLIDQTQDEIKKWHPHLESKIKFMNIEKISRLSINELDNFCEKNQINERTYLILDESLKIKNMEAKRTNFLLKLSQKVKYKLILNGTPISKNLSDLYAQINFLDKRILDYKDYQDFINKHFKYLKYMPWKILEIHNLEYLKNQIKDFIYDSQLDHEIDSIEKIMVEVINDEDIEKAEKNWKAQTSRIKDNAWYKEENLLRWFNDLLLSSERSDAKINYLPKFINDHKKEKIIIMCRYTDNISKIKDILGDKAIIYSGVQKDDLELFKNGDKQYLIMGMRVGTFGINGLQNNCHIMLFYDWPLSPDEIIQATGRINRFGQNKKCKFYQLELQNKIISNLLNDLIDYKNNSLSILNKTLTEIIQERINDD